MKTKGETNLYIYKIRKPRKAWDIKMCLGQCNFSNLLCLCINFVFLLSKECGFPLLG